MTLERHRHLIYFVTSPFFLLAFLLAPLCLLLNEVIRLLLVRPTLFLLYGRAIWLAEDGADAFWGHKQRKKYGSRNCLIYMMTPAGALDVDKIANFYTKHIQSDTHHPPSSSGKWKTRAYAKLEKIMTTRLGYSCWKTCSFNIYNHIRVLDKVVRPKDLQDLFSSLALDMREDKPQWEVLLVERYDDGSGEMKSLVVSRFLHSYMDGLSYMMLFKERVLASMEYTVDPLRFKIPLWRKTLFYMNTALFGPYHMLKMTVDRYLRTPWVPLANPPKDRRKLFAFASTPVSPSALKKVRLHSKVPATVVFSTAFATSVSSHIQRQRSLESLIVSELVAYLPYRSTLPQNRFAVFEYSVGTESIDFYERLEKVKKAWAKAIRGPSILSSFYFFKVTGRLPSFLSRLWLDGNLCSVLLSNVPFSKDKVLFRDGTPVLSAGGFTPHPNDLGLSMTVSKYGEDLRVNACGDSDWLSQAELEDLVEGVVRVIHEAAGETQVKEHKESTLADRIILGNNDLNFRKR